MLETGFSQRPDKQARDCERLILLNSSILQLISIPKAEPNIRAEIAPSEPIQKKCLLTTTNSQAPNAVSVYNRVPGAARER